MRKYWPLLVIVAILAAVIGVSQNTESAKQHCEESTSEVKATAITKSDDSKAGDNTKDARKPPIWASYFTWPNGVGAWAVMLTLLVIAWQSVETRDAAQAARYAAQTAAHDLSISSRAWVTAHIKSTVFQVGAPLLVTVELNNNGSTPAVNTRTCHVATIVDGNGERPAISYPPEKFSRGTMVLMHGNTHGTQRPDNAVKTPARDSMFGDYVLSKVDAEEVERGNRTAVAFGIVEYDDIFGEHHWTKYCLKMVWRPPVGDNPMGTIQWGICEIGNEIDMTPNPMNQAARQNRKS